MIYALVGLISFVFWLWMLIDCIQNKNLSSNEKILWVLVVILLYALGGLIYFALGRKQSST